jgi:hypothetical protein
LYQSNLYAKHKTHCEKKRGPEKPQAEKNPDNKGLRSNSIFSTPSSQALSPLSSPAFQKIEFLPDGRSTALESHRAVFFILVPDDTHGHGDVPSYPGVKGVIFNKNNW